MNKRWLCCPLLGLVIACGPGEADSQDSAAGAQEAVDRALAGDVQSESAPRDACSVFETAFGEVFADSGTAAFKSSEIMGNTVCRATWEVSETGAKRYGNEASLTIMGTSYDSPEAAVASLESAVTTLTEGVTVDVQGEERTVKSGFGNWVEGVGDRAITKKRSVLVAANGRRFTAAVRASDEDSENQALAIELARRVAGRI